MPGTSSNSLISDRAVTSTREPFLGTFFRNLASTWCSSGGKVSRLSSTISTGASLISRTSPEAASGAVEAGSSSARANCSIPAAVGGDTSRASAQAIPPGYLHAFRRASSSVNAVLPMPPMPQSPYATCCVSSSVAAISVNSSCRPAKKAVPGNEPFRGMPSSTRP